MPSPAAIAELAKTPAPQGHSCARCGSPVDQGDPFCQVCDTAQPVAEQPAPPATRNIQCKNCGATIAVPADQLSIVCPFCDSTYVIDAPPGDAAKQPPEFVIGFALTQQQALEKFREWLNQGGIFRPGDLAQAKIEEKLRGVYVPFWSFSMLARSHWSARVGEHWYRTETYTTTENGKTETHTRTVQETEWWGLSGDHHHYYSGYLVSGSRGLPQSYAEGIKPFRLEALKRYQPFYLAGWLSEQYSVERDEALELSKGEFQRWEEKNIAAFMPGDEHSSLDVQTEFSDINSDLILLPVYLLSYRYGDKLFRFLINGQTGKTSGDKPYSSTRIGAAIAIGVIVLLVLLWLFFAARH